ncbi:MAG: hypothetical protein WCT53_01340 [Candidatus Gracilibacteria bacterium]
MAELNLSFIGMAIIIFSWMVQIVYTSRRGKKMTVSFAALQTAGIVCLVVDNYLANSAITTLAALNIGSAVGGLAMVILLLAKK